MEMTALRDELRLAGVPIDGLGQTIMIAHTLRAVGTDEQKQRFIPPALAGEILFALGYTEPDSGSDVAAAKTRAVARRRRVGHRRPEDVHDVGPRGHVRLPAHPHEPRRAQAQGPHDVPGAARHARRRDPPGAHDGRRAHQRHLLHRRARARLPARRRGRRRLGRDDGGAHLRARRVRAERGRPGVAADRRLGDRHPPSRRHARDRRPARPRAARHHAHARRGGAPARAAVLLRGGVRRAAGRRGLDAQAVLRRGHDRRRRRAGRHARGRRRAAARRCRGTGATGGSSTSTGTPGHHHLRRHERGAARHHRVRAASGSPAAVAEPAPHRIDQERSPWPTPTTQPSTSSGTRTSSRIRARTTSGSARRDRCGGARSAAWCSSPGSTRRSPSTATPTGSRAATRWPARSSRGRCRSRATTSAPSSRSTATRCRSATSCRRSIRRTTPSSAGC